jgi:hypothetical protein
MDSIYWVMTFACHRRCVHCYDERFRPYTGAALDVVVQEGVNAFDRIIANLPDDFSVRRKDPARSDRLRGQLILAGGELLIDPVRERLFYPALQALADRWAPAQRPLIGIQTTGDVLTPAILADLLARGVNRIAIASIDDYHVGIQGEKRFNFMQSIRAMMAEAGVIEMSLGTAMDPGLRGALEGVATRVSRDDLRPHFLFFGAQPELWIGELWPRGRALVNGLSNVTYETNLCARWSGGQNFLNYRQEGSEVAIGPDGALYPCCIKTAAPLGWVTEEPLTAILDDLAAEPALQAINAGDPEAMGMARGWSREDFKAQSVQTDGKGRALANPCFGCDAYFKTMLAPVLEARRQQRLLRLAVSDVTA